MAKKKSFIQDIQKFRVTWTFVEPLLGTTPQSKDIYTQYIASKMNDVNKRDEEAEDVPDIEDRGWTGFYRDKDDDRPYLLDYQVKGFFKEAGNKLKDALGVRALRNKIDSYVYVVPRRIYLPEPEPEPLERPLRGRTAQGERIALTRSDMIAAGNSITFELHLIPNKEVNEFILRELMEYGKYHGTGQWRNGGWGRFEYTMERLDDPDIKEAA